MIAPPQRTSTDKYEVVDKPWSYDGNGRYRECWGRPWMVTENGRPTARRYATREAAMRVAAKLNENNENKENA